MKCLTGTRKNVNKQVTGKMRFKCTIILPILVSYRNRIAPVPYPTVTNRILPFLTVFKD
jgi:hypothetical protein